MTVELSGALQAKNRKRLLPAFCFCRALVAKFLLRASARSVETISFSPDHIRVEQLELPARVGVTESERSQPQRLTVSITMWPHRPLVDLGDDIRNTINYSDVCEQTKEFVCARSDKLIETLADRLASHLLKRFPIQKISVELRKFVLPETKFVAVTITRSAAGN